MEEETKRVAFRSRGRMLTSLLRNYGIAITLGAMFLPTLAGVQVPTWKVGLAIAMGGLLCGLAIYVAPCGEEDVADR